MEKNINNDNKPGRGKTALITGATSGIGYELARLFAKDGYNLIIVSRSQDHLQKTAELLVSEFNVNVYMIARDLFHPQAAYQVYEEVKHRGMLVDVLVNDAGQGQYGFFTEVELGRLMDIIRLNIESLTVLTHCFLREMVRRNDGKILQLASIASNLPSPYQAVYHATKAYVLSLTEALINELKDTNVTMTALQPGATDTDFFRKADAMDSKLVEDPDSLSDPKKVAKDGYDALMQGKDKVVSGFKNKVLVAMSHVTPDSMITEQMRKMSEPMDEEEKEKMEENWKEKGRDS